MTSEDIGKISRDMASEIERAIVGKEQTIIDAILTLLCGGHLLIEDVPGVGKTTLAKAISMTIGGEFKRIQFTPDLLPSDITGSSIYNQKESTFHFRKGPLFANVVLVDEINRATPKTQSALLEAMEEYQITSDGETRHLEKPFFVIATQNNIETVGTYPLPEAQLDRFFATVSLGYPSREAEQEILTTQRTASPIDDIKTVISLQEMVAAQRAVREIFVHDTIKEYCVDIVRATRENSQLMLGASPRGSLYLMHAGQARAALDGSDFVRPDDIKYVAHMVLNHRLILRGEVRARGTERKDVVKHILETVPAPVPTS